MQAAAAAPTSPAPQKADAEIPSHIAELPNPLPSVLRQQNVRSGLPEPDTNPPPSPKTGTKEGLPLDALSGHRSKVVLRGGDWLFRPRSATVCAMFRLLASAGAVFGLLGVAAGAFGAHALKKRLEPALLDAFEVGVRYQLVHALALLLLAVLVQRNPSTGLNAAGIAFISGVFLFSFSLYAYALSGVRALAMVTPVGGLCFIVGWGLLAWATWKSA